MESHQSKTLSHYSLSTALSFAIPENYAGFRLDQALAKLCPQHSRSRLQQWIREGRVHIENTPILEPKHKLWGGEHVVINEAPDPETLSFLPQDIPLDIVFEDASLIVINKPAGLVVHPGHGNLQNTLLNALLYHAPALSHIPRAGIVHRLDKDTTGLMVVAKTLESQTFLVRALQARTVKRQYLALVRGLMSANGVVDAPIGRHPTERTKMAVVPLGKPARTHYRVLETFKDCSLVECILETGRTHQIRVHMHSIGHPLVGDALYGTGVSRIPKGPLFSRQALHAYRLGLIHPVSGKSMRWTVKPPQEMCALIDDARLLFQAIESARIAEEEEWDDDGVEVIYAYDEDGEDDELLA